MKYLLLALLLLPLCINAQDTTYSRVITADSFSASNIYKYALTFCQDKERLFVTEDNIKNRRWALGRAKWASTTPILTGVEFADENNKQVVAKVLFAFQRHGATIKFLAIYGDVIIKCKDGKTKIDITNLTYAHVDNEAPPTYEKVSDGNKFCNSTGTIKDLYNCKAGQKTLEVALKFIGEAATGIIDGYEAYLKKTVVSQFEKLFILINLMLA